MPKNREYFYDVQLVRHLVEDCKMTLAEVCAYLEAEHCPASVRSLRRFCVEHSITKKCGLSNREVLQVVRQSVDEVGSYYGRRTLKGHIECNFVQGLSEKRIAAAMKIVDPENHANRSWGTHRRLNPRRYFAPYFAYNLHIDQNEKLVDYGIVFVAAIDGYSSYVFQLATMCRKNNYAIYRDLFKPITIDFGLFKRVHADFGCEFMLTLFMQQYMWLNVDPNIDVQSVYRQSKSTSNNRIERVWVEINQRVGYPLKFAFVELEAFGFMDRDTPHHLYAVSQVGMWVARYGVWTTVNAWNHHFVRGRGVPSALMYAKFGATSVDHDFVLDVDEAAVTYVQSGGGHLTEESTVGCDLLSAHIDFQEARNQTFSREVEEQVGSVGEIFGALVNGNNRPIQTAILLHIRLSENYAYGGEGQD